MDAMTISMEQARQAKTKAGEIVGSLADVIGVGLSRVDGSYVVKVNLLDARPLQLPVQVDGVPVVYEITGPIRKRS